MPRSRKFRSRSMRLEPLEARSLLSTLIALVDTGVELNGPYRPYYDMADAYNAQTNQFASVSGEAVVQDTHGHGRVLTNQTMVGVLDAKNQAGAAGADVKILPISYRNPSTGATSYAAILRGIRHAADLGAAVINVSLGESWNFSAPGLGTISQAVQYAERRGSVVVAPAGNRGFQDQSRGLDVDRSAESAIFPAFADDSAYNRLGVSLSNLLVAAAVDPSGNLTSASNWGPTHVDVGALSNSEGVTSYAAGYASGVTGVIAALTPGWSAAQRVDHMKRTVDPHPQAVGTWSTTGGNISAANAVEALRLPIAVDDAGGSAGGYARSGPWTSYAGLGYEGDHSAAVGVGAAGPATATATWTFSGLAPGRYRVLATWVPADNRATDAPFTVGAGGAAPATVRVDQTDQPSARPVDEYASGRPWWALGGPGQAFEPGGHAARRPARQRRRRGQVRHRRRHPHRASGRPADRRRRRRFGGGLRPARGRGRRTPAWATRGTTRRPSASAPPGRRRRRRPGPSPAWRRAATACWPPGSRRTTGPPTRRSPSSAGGAAPATVRVDQTDQPSARPVDEYASGRPWWALGGPGQAFEPGGHAARRPARQRRRRGSIRRRGRDPHRVARCLELGRRAQTWRGGVGGTGDRARPWLLDLSGLAGASRRRRAPSHGSPDGLRFNRPWGLRPRCRPDSSWRRRPR